MAVVVVVAAAAVADGRPLPLAPYDAGAFTISMPKGWVVQGDSSKGAVVAQQDPKRKDAATAIVMATTSTQATDDQLLDQIAMMAGADRKIVARGAAAAGGKQLVVDGATSDGLKIRLGAVAIVGGSGVIVAILVAKRGEFDTLGGIDTVLAILTSIKVQTAAPRDAPVTDAPTKDAPMTPHFDSYGYLIVPPPQRAIVLADLVGEWSNDGGSVKGMYTSSGQYAGYRSVAIADRWRVDGTGKIADTFNGVRSGGGAQQVSERKTGTVSIHDNEIHITWSTMPSHTAIYLVHGWFVSPDATIMNIDGPYWDQVPDRARIATTMLNVNNNWIRKN
ncbi:MAG TPA: hypothetical protein VLX92_20405 [Kofleriaceae bacterium]|nr:hypothetical protein [Kofleriaceae bacterium]